MRIDAIKLRSELFKKNMTQTELSKRANVSRPVISSVCRGSSCSKETADKIANVLGLPVNELIEIR